MALDRPINHSANTHTPTLTHRRFLLLIAYLKYDIKQCRNMKEVVLLVPFVTSGSIKSFEITVHFSSMITCWADLALAVNFYIMATSDMSTVLYSEVLFQSRSFPSYHEKVTTRYVTTRVFIWPNAPLIFVPMRNEWSSASFVYQRQFILRCHDNRYIV